MIRYNFINEFKALAQKYSHKNHIKVKDFDNDVLSSLNKQMYEHIKKEFTKEIPYVHLIYSEIYQRDIITYIPNKDLHERFFKKNKVEYPFTTDLMNYVKQSEIPLDNFILEIDCGRINDLASKPKTDFIINENENKIYNSTQIDINKVINADATEAKFKTMDLDGLEYLVEKEKGVYFYTQDSQGINSIIMLENNNGLFLLHYVAVAHRSKGNGLALKLYETAMNHIIDNNGLLIRSEPSELGKVFIEKKITNMLASKFPYEPILSDLTKDLHSHLRLIMSTDINKSELNSIKTALKNIISSRSHLEKVDFMGEFSEYQILSKMTDNDKKILTDSLSFPKKTGKKKSKNF